jgi:hypothetical protein
MEEEVSRFIDTILGQQRDTAPHCTAYPALLPPSESSSDCQILLSLSVSLSLSLSLFLCLSLLTGSIPRIEREKEEEVRRLESNGGENPSAWYPSKQPSPVPDLAFAALNNSI